MYTNEEIPSSAGISRSADVRLIGKDGEQLGIVKLATALDQAYDADLDLVLMSAQSTPAVCRIMDYGKFCFERDKREKEAKKKQQKVEIKEVQLSCRIDVGDFNTKMSRARKFLEDGNKVKVLVQFRGRQMTHLEIGTELLNRFAEGLSELGAIDKKPVLEGRRMIMFISPIKKQ